jgi:4-hydroxy-tetrahydrodipicolinate reductase
MKLNVCIAGATGWVGKPLCLAVFGAEDMRLVGAVSRTHQGQSLKDVLGEPSLDLMITGSVAEALDTSTDVLVDYTKADAVKANVMTAIRRGVHVVIGSSGLTDEDFVAQGRSYSCR